MLRVVRQPPSDLPGSMQLVGRPALRRQVLQATTAASKASRSSTGQLPRADLDVQALRVHAALHIQVHQVQRLVVCGLQGTEEHG